MILRKLRHQLESQASYEKYSMRELGILAKSLKKQVWKRNYEINFLSERILFTCRSKYFKKYL